MLRGFYTAASGMIAQQRRQEALSNNIANANTPGYKADEATLRAFPEMLLQQMGTKHTPTKRHLQLPVQQPIGRMNTGVYVHETIPNFAQGDITETGISTDVALVNRTLPDETGSLFFTVQNESGEVRYTRNGNFTVDGQGFLVTNEGYYVLDNGQNRIQTNRSEFTISPEGLVEAEGQTTELGIMYIENVGQLVKEGNGLLRGEANINSIAPGQAGATFMLKQRYLERSNVDSLQSMTQMMEAYRMFESNQRVLKAYDESMGKAVNEIGRLG
ncbi:flagellar hook-basal body protein [Virgibacillus sp. W0430]|uniref:flagellar hook-basal body protein n=1 Tax=Virgibacillus sp. W0430 TaxID=3391580 RepID=UPI003F44F393